MARALRSIRASNPATTDRRIARWGIGGALAGALFALLLFAPAHWLASAVASLSNGQFLLADARGTVWDGSAQLVLTGGEGSHDAAGLPGRIEWSARPQLGGLEIRASADCCMAQPATLLAMSRWGGWQLAVATTQSRWPAALLRGLGTPWNTMEPEGSLSLFTQGLSVEWVEGRLNLQGQARLEAMQMSSRLSTIRPMGSYRITINGGATSTVQLETLEGSLLLSGSGQWVGSRLRFSGEASAAPGREAALDNLLNIIGRRNGARSIITVG